MAEEEMPFIREEGYKTEKLIQLDAEQQLLFGTRADGQIDVYWRKAKPAQPEYPWTPWTQVHRIPA